MSIRVLVGRVLRWFIEAEPGKIEIRIRADLAEAQRADSRRTAATKRYFDSLETRLRWLESAPSRDAEAKKTEEGAVKVRAAQMMSKTYASDSTRLSSDGWPDFSAHLD